MDVFLGFLTGIGVMTVVYVIAMSISGVNKIKSYERKMRDK